MLMMVWTLPVLFDDDSSGGSDDAVELDSFQLKIILNFVKTNNKTQTKKLKLYRNSFCEHSAKISTNDCNESCLDAVASHTYFQIFADILQRCKFLHLDS